MVCGRWSVTSRVPYLNEGRHADPHFASLELLSCGNCGVSSANPSPSAESLREYYSRVYSPPKMNPIRDDRWPIWDERAASLLLLAKLNVEFRENDLFIDVGPGNGASLSLSRFMFESPSTGCVELNERSVEFFRRHSPDTQIKSNLDEFCPLSATVVLCSHYLEHLPINDLRKELRSIHRVLRPGGVFVLEVPHEEPQTVATLDRHTPHLTFFGQTGLSLMLQKSGFKIRFLQSFKGSAGGRLGSADTDRKGLSGNDRIRVSVMQSGEFTCASDDESRRVLKCVVQRP